MRLRSKSDDTHKFIQPSQAVYHAQFDGCISKLPRLVACVRALIAWRAGLLDEKRPQSCA